MSTRLYLLPGGDRDETNSIPIVFGHEDEDEFFYKDEYEIVKLIPVRLSSLLPTYTKNIKNNEVKSSF